MTSFNASLVLLSLSAATLFHALPASADEAPTIPLLPNNTPVLDSVIKPDEWRGALVLSAGGVGKEADTTFYLKHDGKALWVATRSAGVAGREIRAHARGPEGLLTLDDTVSVALGLDGEIERTISMGGYEGAMTGKLGTMAHLYEFMVNAVGSTARRYNESPLPTQRFAAKVSRNGQAWTSEMRIPFASLGLSNPASREIYANFVHYLAPGAVSWEGATYWGNYTPFPVKRIRLAASVGEAATPIDASTPASPAAAIAEVKAPVKPSLELNFYPLANMVFGEAKLPDGGSAILNADDKIAKATAVTVSEAARLSTPVGAPIARVSVNPAPRPAPGESIKANLQTLLPNGTSGPSTDGVFQGIAKPSWSGTDAGAKFVDSKVPSPWTMPKIEKDTVRLVHVALTFGGNALPKSIHSSTDELLASPIDVLAWSKGKRVAVQWQARPTLTARGNRVIVHGKGRLNGVAIEVRTEVEFDGFMTTQLHLGKTPPGIDRVQISCPLQAAHARFTTQGSVQNVVPLTNFDYYTSGGQYVDRCWVGAENIGLNFSTDLPFFHSTDHRDEIAIKNEGAARSLILTPFDRAEQIKRNPTLQFYLQPTPSRPRSTVTSDDYNLWFEQWSDYQGYPDLAKMEQVKDFSAKTRAEGKLPLLYFNQMLAENTPEFIEYRQEMLNLPPKMWYKRAYDGPGKGVPAYVCCVRGPYGDLLLDGIRKLIDQGGIGGIYMDGTEVAWYCDNPAHGEACDGARPPEWNRPGLSRITGTRDFLKRLRGLFTERGKKFILAGHTGGDLDINTLSFVDYFWEGEQLARYLPDYRIPQPQFAIGYSGGPWGYRTQFFDMGWVGNRGENWSLIYTLLFNADNQRDNPRRFLRPFEVSGSAFHPYWKDGQKLLQKSKTARTSVSYYTAPQNATMVVASNLDFTPDQVEINVGSLAAKDAIWVDLLTGKQYAVTAGMMRLSMPGYRGVALRPLSQVSSADKAMFPSDMTEQVPAVAIKGMQLAQWQAPDESVAKREEPAAGAAPGTGWLKLTSVPGTPENPATLTGVEFGHDLEFTLKMKASNRVKFDLGSVIILHDANWRLDVQPTGWNEGRIYQRELPVDRVVTLKVALHGDRLSAWLDGEALIDNMQIRLRPQPRGQLKISTWAGDTLDLQLVDLNTRAVEASSLAPVHPAEP